MGKIRVLVVDDHRVVRRGLAMALRVFDDLELVGEAANGIEAVDLCIELHPDVVLMDLVMPEMDGVEATRRIRARYPDIQVIAMTASKEGNRVEEVLQAGAGGYLLKNASIDDLANLILANADICQNAAEGRTASDDCRR